MISRSCAIAFVAVGIASIAAAGAAPARPAGLVAGHGGVHRMAVRPFAGVRHMPPLLVANRDHARFRAMERHRRAHDIGIYYAPGYAPLEDPAYVEPDQAPVEVETTGAVPPAGDQLARSPGGCRARIYKVPSEDGGERVVTVQRC
jgi:hypothetical protein